MLITQFRLPTVAVRVVLLGAFYPSILSRVSQIQVVFPDFGLPFTAGIGFFRYPGETRFIPESTLQEIHLPQGLTSIL